MTERMPKLNKLLKEEIAKVLAKGEGFDRRTLITVTRVKTTKDLAEAKVFVSVLPEERTKEILDFFQKNIYHIQQELNKKLVLKHVPKIVFCKEEKTAEAGRVEELLEEIHKDDE